MFLLSELSEVSVIRLSERCVTEFGESWFAAHKQVLFGNVVKNPKNGPLVLARRAVKRYSLWQRI